MCGIDVEEAATIGAQHLDGDLRSDRPKRDGLLGAFQRGGVDIGAEGLGHAEPDEDERQHDADGQQHVERGAGQVDPEIAERFSRSPGKTADQRHRDGDAGGGRDEVLDGQAGHLHEIGHRAFAAVVLPVGVGDKAGRGVEGQLRRNGGHAGRVERQNTLETLQKIEQNEAGQIEQQHRGRIGRPVLLLILAGAGDAVEATFDRAEDRRERSPLTVENAGHVAAERLYENKDEPAEKQDLDPSDKGHGGGFPGVAVRTVRGERVRR